jgi:hypothetical protein
MFPRNGIDRSVNDGYTEAVRLDRTVKYQVDIMNKGIVIFPSPLEAIRAGFEIESPYADSEGFLHARLHTAGGWTRALVRV